MRAGVIGLGQMGRGIAANLARAGLLAAAWDIVPAAREAARLPAEVLLVPPDALAAIADVVLFAVPSSTEIEASLDGPHGVLAATRPGQVLIDLTTSRPADTIRLAQHAAMQGRAYLDAGMSGGAAGAEAGRLTLMLGGPAEVLERCRPVLDVIATGIFHLGATGAGHTMKLVHNMVCHANFLALAEGCRMAERAGLALPEVIAVVNAGNARSYISEARFPNHVLSGRFDGRSRIANLAKDLGMAAEFASQTGQASPYTALTAGLLERAMAAGWSEDDFTTLYPRYDTIAG